YPEFEFTREALKRRMAAGADVKVVKLSEQGIEDITELLEAYIAGLRATFQADEAEKVSHLLQKAHERFVMIVPADRNPPKAE
ncbi:MAG: hypothetical protein ACOCPN_02970, partial [Desulfonatronovibrionaceae bacterium]